VLWNIFGSRRDKVAGNWRNWHTEEFCDLYFLPNVILVIVSKRKRCVSMRHGWTRGIFWFLVGRLEGTNNLEVLGMYGRVIFSGSVRNGSSLDWEELSLDGDLCQAVVKNEVNHWVA
jgi:hypothetical protein